MNSLKPAIPLSEIESPVVTETVPPRLTGKPCGHSAGLELATAASSVRLAMNQLSHALDRGAWSPATRQLATEVETSLAVNRTALEAIVHLAANNRGEAL